jgi:predicted RNA-binding Zn-ribbon protein involved in translation (DUF1610 family)
MAEETEYKPQTWMQEKVLNTAGYSPYCGNSDCKTMPRTRFNGSQFVCPHCGWTSEFPAEFIKAYKKKWNL